MKYMPSLIKVKFRGKLLFTSSVQENSEPFMAKQKKMLG